MKFLLILNSFASDLALILQKFAYLSVDLTLALPLHKFELNLALIIHNFAFNLV